jgi:hypothetical protein
MATTTTVLVYFVDLLSQIVDNVTPIAPNTSIGSTEAPQDN